MDPDYFTWKRENGVVAIDMGSENGTHVGPGICHGISLVGWVSINDR